MSALPEAALPRASIVIVTWNGRALLERCLGAVVAQADEAGAEVIVVDNASSDGSDAYVRAAFPHVILVGASRNEGFAEGCNIGVRAARSSVIVLLNNDALPRTRWLRALLAPLERPEVAISCSVVYEERFDPAYALGTGSISVIGHPIPNVAQDPSRPFYATGCSLAFKAPLLGVPFDGLYFAYFEDTLLSWRARLAGYEVARALDSGVDHLGSVTARRQPGLMQFYWERNKLMTLLTCYEWASLVRLVPLYGFDALARVAEDCWHLVRPPGRGGRDPAGVMGRYLAGIRATWWLVTHRSLLAARRRQVQRGRVIPDRLITVQQSGKIFDDLVPTWGHRFANAGALAYLRLAGVVTAESAGG